MNNAPLFNKPTRQEQILARMAKYHKDHPEVFRLFCQYAQQVIDAKWERYSSDCVFHRIRWHVTIEAKDTHGFKLNNDYTAYYARMFELKHPEHKGLFEKRTCKSAGRDAFEIDLAIQDLPEKTMSENLEDFLKGLL